METFKDLEQYLQNLSGEVMEDISEIGCELRTVVKSISAFILSKLVINTESFQLQCFMVLYFR
ncbi:hypothetical protein [Anaerophaga thermohalophila]|jgi:BMFP domain-containing protein YqiC|uniref:hypothetical protein n=1 Tax=Anaerophaga thermohalophila TaxID=177400 RepID=UPI000314E139|nr:hypothetical protein [Anaerophaga thermohalophila]